MSRLMPLALATCALAGLLGSSSAAQIAQPDPEYTGDDRVEEWHGKTVLAITPHPDDETFTSGGTLAILAKSNDVHVLIYTSDNAGSRDPTMTHERLASIRKNEEEEACRALGIPIENITWLGHDDGMLEYVDRRRLTRQVARELRRIRPDVVFSIDPGAPSEQYHKSDHRSGAVITADAIRAARWRLYFPELEEAGFEAFSVPLVLFYYSAHPNYTVDISETIDAKVKAAAAHSSQFGDLVDRYSKERADAQRPKVAKGLKARAPQQDGRYIERFRRSEG